MVVAEVSFTSRCGPTPTGFGRLLCALLRWLPLSLVLVLGTTLAQAEPLRLAPGVADQPLWPAVRVLVDAGNRFEAASLARAPSNFERPAIGVAGNLGRVDATIWLRAPLHVAGDEPLQRILEIDYPALNRVDVYLVRGGLIVSHQVLGNSLPMHERVLASRTLAAPLTLAPGDHELLLRVQTETSAVLPITLRTPASFMRYESRVQLVQGLIFGLGLCMLLYSLLHWLHLREGLFLHYALLLAGNGLFTLAFFGIGPQWVWPHWPALSMQVAPVGIMLAIAAAATFMISALGVREINLLAWRVLHAVAALALAGLAANLLGLLDYRASQTLVTVLGLTVPLVVLPLAFARARRGDRAAVLILAGWAFYMMGAFTTAGLLRGFIEPTFWSQHIYPFTLLVEMTAWMAVLGMRVQSIHRSADRAQLEADAQRRLAETDALTGLPQPTRAAIAPDQGAA
jgi:diguanylate cyclase